MKFENACEKALQYLNNEWGDTGFSSILDLGGKWLFNGINKEKSVVYGKQGVTVNKETGKIELFILPNENNFNLLDLAVDVDIPEKYIVSC